MSLLAQVQAGVDLAFRVTDDLVAEVWLTRQQQNGYDATTGDATVTEVEFKFEGIVDTAKESGESISDTGTAGSEVDGSEANVILKPGATDPQVGDVLRIGDRRHRVLNVEPVKPDGETVIIWQLKVAV